MIDVIANAKRVAFQGEPGAYANLAAKEAVPHADYIPQPTFEDAVDQGADDRPADWCGPVGAALADRRGEFGEGGERGQRVVIVLHQRYVQEGNAVIEPEGGVAEPFGLLLGELGEHGPDQLLVLLG